jgi:hypothetical protein
MGGWVALEIDDGYQLPPAAASTGLEIASKANTASVTFDPTINLQEG